MPPSFEFACTLGCELSYNSISEKLCQSTVVNNYVMNVSSKYWTKAQILYWITWENSIESLVQTSLPYIP